MEEYEIKFVCFFMFLFILIEQIRIVDFIWVFLSLIAKARYTFDHLVFFNKFYFQNGAY